MAPPKKKSALPALRWLLLLPIPVLWCVLSHLGLLGFLESKSLDWRFRYRGEIDAPVKVIYVDIDSQSIDEIGNMPWSRAYFARAASALVNQAGVKAVGIDVVFSENGMAEAADRKKMVEGNIELSRFLFRNPPVVLAASYSAAQFRDRNTQRLMVRDLPLLIRETRSLDQIEPPEVPSFNVGRKIPWSPPLVGLIDTLDGGTSWVPAFTPTATRTYRHMAIELALAYWGLTGEAVKTFNDRLEIVRPDGRHVTTIPLRDKQLIEINWFSPWISISRNPRIGFSTVYNYAEMLGSDKEAEKKTARDFFAQPDFKDAVVLIGPVDPLLQDLAATPFDEVPVPKVGVHGNLLKTIVTGEYIVRLPDWARYVLVFALTLLVSWFAAVGGVKGARAKLTAALLLTAYAWVAFWLFKTQNLVLPLAAPVGSVFTTSFAAIIWQLIEEEKQKGRIKGMFGTYVSPQLVSRMIESGESPQLGGHEQEITAYFSDIQSFSTFSEKLGSGPLVDLMNEYLTVCTDIVQEEGGTLDKYIGDAVVAMFGAPIALPDHAFRACVASQRVHQKLGELRVKWKGEAGKWPEIVWKMQSRIGLNSGPATIGNMGSRTRFNYTMMGDNVNLAARMESGAKQYGVYTMTTGVTKLACEQHGGDRLVFRYLDQIVVKGRSIPVPVYEIVGLKESVTEQAQECLRLFQHGIQSYLAQDWEHATEFFKRSAALEPNIPGQTPGVESNPSLVLIERCAKMKLHPPGDRWDGVYIMKEK